jgi:hypothetical protein
MSKRDQGASIQTYIDDGLPPRGGHQLPLPAGLDAQRTAANSSTKDQAAAQFDLEATSTAATPAST